MNKIKKRHINIINTRIAQHKDLLNNYEEQKGTEDLCLNIRIRISECKQIIDWIKNDIGGYK